MSVEGFPSIKPQSVVCLLEPKEHIVFSIEPEAFRGVVKVPLISNFYIFLFKKSFSSTLSFRGKRKIKLNQGKF